MKSMMALQAICASLLAFSCLLTAVAETPPTRFPVPRQEVGEGCYSVCLSKEIKKLHEEIQAVTNSDKLDKVLEQMQKVTDQQNLKTIAKKIKEVRITGGKAEATTSLGGGWSPVHAFDPNDPNGWHSGSPDNFPFMIWYEFKHSFLPAEVSFRPRQDGDSNGYYDSAPSRFQVVGSNDVTCDRYATWSILCEDLSDKSFQNKFETRFCKVKEEMNEKFRCVGLRVLGNHKEKYGYCALNNIRMWERV